MEEIARELKPYASGVSKEYLREYFLDKKKVQQLKLAYIKASKGSISCDYLDKKELSVVRIERFLTLLRLLIASKDIPNSFEMIFSMHDSLSINEPIFTVARKKNSCTILCPDFFVLQGYQDVYSYISKGNQSYPWEKKVDIAYWRGQTTGALYSYPDCLNLPRVKLVKLSTKHPQILDCAFTGYVQFLSSKDQKLFEKKFPKAPAIPINEQIQYKYLIDVDGNACNDSRTYWMLHSNSVLIKQKSPFEFWFSSQLKPFEHYVPIAMDLSDLIEKVHWLKQNDTEAKNIALSSSSLARDIYRISNQRKYLSSLIKGYIDLLY